MTILEFFFSDYDKMEVVSHNIYMSTYIPISLLHNITLQNL